MKKYIFRTLPLVTGLFFIIQGCKEEVNLPEQDESQYNQVYMPQAANGVVERKLNISSDDQVIVFGANFGGRAYPESDIKVSFTIDAAAVASYNVANNTSYELLPAASYQVSGSEAIIKKGNSASEPMRIAVKTSGASAIEMFKTYILAVTMNSDFKTNPNLKTTYFLITSEPNIANYPDFNRSAWQIVNFSSEEATGEGPNNGRAIFAMDSNVQTFWHSQWRGASPGPPHHITIDMGAEQIVHGVNITPRQVDGAGGKPQLVKIETSLDNVTWRQSGEFTLTNTRSQQKKWLPVFINARYIKYVVVSSFSSTSAHLAEFGAY